MIKLGKVSTETQSFKIIILAEVDGTIGYPV